MNLSTAAKMAVIPTAAVALLTMRWAVAHTFTLMIWVAVIAGMVAVASTAKAKRAKPAKPEQVSATDMPAVFQRDATRQAQAMLPPAQPQVADLYTVREMHRMN